MPSRTLLSSALLLTAVGCSGGTDATRSPSATVTLAQSSVTQLPATSVPADSVDAAVTANNAFAVELYANALQATPDGNVLTSPISATLALTMTYAGAQGQTKTEMAAALHLPADATDAVFAGQNGLSQALNARGAAALAAQTRRVMLVAGAPPSADDYQLQVVNSVWGERTYTWEAPFLDHLAENYGTGVYQQDFVHASEPARVTINAWVSEHTNDKINDLIPQGSVNEETRMVLVNAIHLKLPWQEEFSANATHPGAFTRGDGGAVSAQFMAREADMAYVDDGRAQIVSLPLSNGEISVVIALPHADVSLADYEAGLTSGSAALATPSKQQRVSLELPKATFTSKSVSLTSALQAMGMKQAFNPDLANFQGVCAHPPDGRRLYVGDVIQKAMISMQESGVEAAAATAVILAGNAAGPMEQPVPVPMRVNRPYLVAIVDNPTGAVLMLGQIQDPTDAGSP